MGMKFSIRAKLLVGFGVVVAAIAVTTALTYFSTSGVANDVKVELTKAERISVLGEDLRATMNLARQGEKDFLLNYKAIGLEEAAEQLGRGQAVANANAMLDIIDQLESEGVDHAQLELARAEVLAYVTAVETLIENVVARGHVDLGLEGEFRTAVKSVEGLLGDYPDDKATISMLMLRRREKDYLRRHREKDITSTHGAAATLARLWWM